MRFRYGTSLMILLIFAATAHAGPVLLTPVGTGNTFPALGAGGALPPGGAWVAGPTLFSSNTHTAPLDGTTEEGVYAEAGTGFLDFVYQMNVTSGGGVLTMTLNGYNWDGGATPDFASYVTPGTAGVAVPGQEPPFVDPPTGTNPIPNDANRTSDADRIHFIWLDPGFGPGTSAILIVHTEATKFTTVTDEVLMQDTGQFKTNGYAPVPEPAYAGLLLGGLFGAGLLVARRLQARSS